MRSSPVVHKDYFSSNRIARSCRLTAVCRSNKVSRRVDVREDIVYSNEPPLQWDLAAFLDTETRCNCIKLASLIRLTCNNAYIYYVFKSYKMNYDTLLSLIQTSRLVNIIIILFYITNFQYNSVILLHFWFHFYPYSGRVV